MRKAWSILFLVCIAMSLTAKESIDRKKVVTRHNPHVTAIDTLASLTVGNGGFAFTVDATGLQTFPELYSKGVPLGTMSDWGWHSFPNKKHYKHSETLVARDFHRGQEEYYAAQFKENGRQKDASNYFRQNPHRLHLGTIGFAFDTPALVTDVDETLDMWTGKVESTFRYAGHKYHVMTVCDPDNDVIASHIESDSTIEVVLRFPYPTGAHSDDACNWNAEDKHTTELSVDGRGALITRVVDGVVYFVNVECNKGTRIRKKDAHTVSLTSKKGTLEFYAGYSGRKPMGFYVSQRPFADFAMASAGRWREYWNTGGFIDFSNVSDPRAHELERRVILSQYLMGAQEAGILPPQETGLTYNSWFGKFHLEMVWWHLAHYGLWNKPDILENPMKWYFYAANNAKGIAQRQGFPGVRWMKMTDPAAGEAPSNVGSYLIWQQPHVIYLAELLYRAADNDVRRKAVLDAYACLVDLTALFMGRFAEYDSVADRFIIRGCIPAQETLKADSTINPPFELAYWYTALDMARKWRERRGEEPVARWDSIIAKLSPLAYNADSLYLAAETATATYTDRRFTSDHPALLGALGVMPHTPLVNDKVMTKTLDWIWDNWNWDETWGWDFPMVAMTCARLGLADRAVDALLMPKRTNTYLVNGHNYQDKRLRVYMPGNGGLLTAVAMMCAGWDGAEGRNPGFPSSWDVRWEGLLPMP